MSVDLIVEFIITVIYQIAIRRIRKNKKINCLVIIIYKLIGNFFYLGNRYLYSSIYVYMYMRDNVNDDVVACEKNVVMYQDVEICLYFIFRY